MTAMSSSVRIPALAVLLAATAAAQADVTRTGKTFVVTVHPGKLSAELAARLADETLAAAEAVRPLLDKWLMVPPKPPVLHLHADTAAFRHLEKKGTNYSFVVDDFCAPDGSAAHVLLWPELSAAIVGELGLPPWVAQTVQRCAGQTAALQVSEAARKDRWLADVFGWALRDAVGNPRGAYGVDPCFDERRIAFSRYRAEGNAIDLDLVLGQFPIGVPNELSLHEERTTLVGQLCAETGSGWARKLLGKAGKPPAPTREGFVANTLGKDQARNEARFDAVVASLAPVWDGWCAGTARDGRIVLAGTTKSSAWLEALNKPPAGPYVVRCRVEIAGVGQSECRICLDDDGKTVVAVVLVPAECSVQRWSYADEKWQRLKKVAAPIAAGKPFDLHVQVDSEIRVSIDGAPAIAVPCNDRDMHHAWSIATNESLLRLADVRCEPYAPPKQK